MKSSEYWQKRFASLEKRQMNKSAEYFKRLEEQYRKAAAEIERDLSKWYARVAVNNEISMAEAKKLLTDNELEEFKWSVDEYIEKGQTLTYSDQWSKQLENASAKVHISRLEAMKLQVQQSVEALYGGEQSSFDNRMREVFSDSYYRTGYEVQKGTGIGYDLTQLDDRRISKVIDKPWAPDGNNFSDRIWKQKNQLVSELHTQITQAAIRGLTPEQAIKSIKEQFNVSSGQAGRLVMTETAYFHSVGQLDMFKELGVEEYEITAVLDSKTSPICQELDGTHLPLSQFQVGVTAPPFHCWCRTTTVPYFDDEFTEDELRAARDEEGNTYQVPSDMTYKEWKDTFVEEMLDNDSGSSKIEIDELTPCLRRMSDGKLVDTTVEIINPKKADFRDWEFDWTIPNKNGYTVYAIKADGDDRIQGMIALKADPENAAVSVDIVEAAPFNNPHNPLFVKKEYAGVGGHLFAEAVKQSYENGFDGFVYFKAKTDLILHYQKEMGAFVVNPKERIMAIDERGAEKLYGRYYRNK